MRKPEMCRKWLAVGVTAGLLCAAGAQSWAVAIIKGPYLQRPTQTSVVMMWETDVACAGRVEYGPSAGYGWAATDDRTVTIHEVEVTDLVANSLYHYRVISGDASSGDAIFRTAPPPGVPFRFAAYGDTRSQPSEHQRVVKRIIASRPRLVIHAGDIVGNGNSYEEWQTQFFDPAAPLIRKTPMAFTLGNHENNSHWYYDFCSNPAGAGTEAWYAFRYGDARFICINSCQSYEPGSDQHNWLEKTLAEATDAIWTFVFFHHPPYTSGGHKGDEKVQQHLVPLFEHYRVAIVFNGHCHNYERSVNNGVVYIVTGGGGAPLASVKQGAHPHQVCADSLYHHCVIDIDGERLTCRGVRADNGEEFDEFTLTRAPAERSGAPSQ